MQSHPIRVLLVDDNEDDYTVIRDLLSNLSSMEFILKWVSDYRAARDAILSGEFDVCLLDCLFNGRNGLEFMEEAISRGATTPIVFLTGHGGCDRDLEAMSKGAAGWFSKDELNAALLERAIRHAMEQQPKRVELIKAKRVIQALSECNHAVIHIEDEAELLRAVCRIVVDVGGYKMAWVGYAGEDRDRTVTPVARYGYDEDYLETVKVTWKDAERGRGPMGACIRTGIPITIRSVGSQAEAEPWRVEALERGYASAIGLPLFLDGRRLGALSIYSSETDAFNMEEIEFLLKLSGNLSYGIGVLRLRKAQMQAEESLKKANLDLERRVGERTAELVKVNAELRKEVEERRQAEEALKEGERKFRAIFDQTFQFMGLLTVDGRLIEGNRIALQFSGVQESEVMGKPFWETPWWTHSTELQETMRAAVKKAASGEVVRFEPTHFSADGSLHCMDFSLKPLMDEAGGVAFLIAEARDINERKQAEEALHESESRLRQIIDLVPHMIFVKDWEGKYLLVNKAGAESYNTSVSALTGKYQLNFHPDESELQNMLQDDREVITKGETKFIPEEPYTDAQGNLRFLQTIKVPFCLPGDKTPAVLGVAVDITERKRSEEALQAAHEQLKGIIEFLPDATFVIDVAGRVIAWNRAIEEMTGVRKEKMIGMGDYAYAVPFYGEPRPILIDFVMKSFERPIDFYNFIEAQDKLLSGEVFAPNTYEGRGAYLWGTASPLFNKTGSLIGAVEAIRDITDQKDIESTLFKREADLIEKAHQLEEINTALKVLLRRREEDKKDLEESLLTNVKESILPFLEKLKKTRLDENQKTYLMIVESQLLEITSPFLKSLSSKFTSLTPMEIKVAKLIKEGMASKEIAEILGVAEQTILTHRNNLRAKLGLRNERVNLRSHLMSLT